MRAETRHQLKQDKFRQATGDTVHWAAEHQRKLAMAGIAVVVLGAVILGTWYYFERQDRTASVELGKAIRSYEMQVRPAGVPEQPDFPSFASLAERAKAAHQQFQTIAGKYPHTKSGEIALYFSGLTAMDLNDNASAERDLKKIASAHDQDLAALARFALASVYRNTNRDTQAVELYKQLIDKPARTLSKASAQLELASLYKAKQQGAEARRLYEQIQKENPNTEVASLAASKLQEMK